ncbi:SRPBCC family protein [Bradyrhizobium barranii]
MTWTLVGIAVVIVIIVAVLGIGAMLPENHRVEAERTVAADPHRVWQLISSPQEAPQWRSDLKSAEQVAPDLVKETDKKGKSLSFRTVESKPPTRLVRQIADAGLPFGGAWTISVEPVQQGSRVRVVEDGFVKPPLFRFLMRFVFGQSATMNKYLDDLANHLK